jgi:hypothetical protein
VDALLQESKEAGITPEEVFNRWLRKVGVNPDAPYVPPDNK